MTVTVDAVVYYRVSNPTMVKSLPFVPHIILIGAYGQGHLVERLLKYLLIWDNGYYLLQP